MGHSQDDMKLSVFGCLVKLNTSSCNTASFLTGFVFIFLCAVVWCFWPIAVCLKSQLKMWPKHPKGSYLTKLSQENMPSHIQLLFPSNFLRCVNICININSTAETNWTSFTDVVNRNGILSPWIKGVSLSKVKILVWPPH